MEPSLGQLAHFKGGVLGHGTQLELNLLGAIGAAVGDDTSPCRPRGSVLMTAGVVGVTIAGGIEGTGRSGPESKPVAMVVAVPPTMSMGLSPS